MSDADAPSDDTPRAGDAPSPEQAATAGAAAPGDEDDARKRAKAVRTAQIALVVVVVVIGAIVLLTRGGDDGGSGKATSSDATSSDAAGGGGKTGPGFPADLQRRPAALGKNGQAAPDVTPSAQAKPGIYIWSDFDGWHLWVVNGEGVPEVHGTVIGNKSLAKVALAVPGAGTVAPAIASIDQAQSRSTFVLPTQPGLVGIDLNPGYSTTVTFDLTDQTGKVIDPKLVFLGSGRVHPSNGLTFVKS
jgi:hypothetical protein